MMNVITIFHVYALEETLISSGYAMIEEYNEIDFKEQVNLLKQKLNQENHHYLRALKLLKAPLNSGHCSFAKGIIVNDEGTLN